MPSVNIEDEQSKSEPGTFARLGRKLCCCKQSVQPVSRVELTKAQTVTEQPTSSRISIIKKDAFEEEDMETDFHTVELQVPGAEEKANRTGSNTINSILKKRQVDVERSDFKKISAEEVPPDTAFLDVIEEATDVEVAHLIDEKNGHIVDNTPHNSIQSDEEALESKDANEIKLCVNVESEPNSEKPLVTKTTAPVEKGDFKIYSINRKVELDEMNDRTVPWSPEKPPRRASQLLAPIVINSGPNKCDVEGEIESTESTDDGIVPDIVLTRVPDLEHQHFEVSTTTDTIQENHIAVPESQTFPNDKNENERIADAYDLEENAVENTRSVGTMAADETLESDYEDSLSTTVTERSFADDSNEADQNNFVTRLSVRSNGEVLVSSPTFNGPIVKVKLGSIKEGLQPYKDEDLSGKVV